MMQCKRSNIIMRVMWHYDLTGWFKRMDYEDERGFFSQRCDTYFTLNHLCWSQMTNYSCPSATSESPLEHIFSLFLWWILRFAPTKTVKVNIHRRCWRRTWDWPTTVTLNFLFPFILAQTILAKYKKSERADLLDKNVG